MMDEPEPGQQADKAPARRFVGVPAWRWARIRDLLALLFLGGMPCQGNHEHGCRECLINRLIHDIRGDEFVAPGLGPLVTYTPPAIPEELEREVRKVTQSPLLCDMPDGSIGYVVYEAFRMNEQGEVFVQSLAPVVATPDRTFRVYRRDGRFTLFGDRRAMVALYDQDRLPGSAAPTRVPFYPVDRIVLDTGWLL